MSPVNEHWQLALIHPGEESSGGRDGSLHQICGPLSRVVKYMLRRPRATIPQRLHEMLRPGLQTIICHMCLEKRL